MLVLSNNAAWDSTESPTLNQSCPYPVLQLRLKNDENEYFPAVQSLPHMVGGKQKPIGSSQYKTIYYSLNSQRILVALHILTVHTIRNYLPSAFSAELLMCAPDFYWLIDSRIKEEKSHGTYKLKSVHFHQKVSGRPTQH